MNMEVQNIIQVTCDCGNTNWLLHIGKMRSEITEQDVVVLSGSCSLCNKKVVYTLEQPRNMKKARS
jgi:hypothetical protein